MPSEIPMVGGGLNVQYGAGWSVAEGWLNYDASPSVWLERLPLIGRFIRVNEQRFPEGIVFGDIVKGLPLQDKSVKALYASHVLEHLSLRDCEAALRNSLRVLKPGGVFRLVVPDLEARARLYIDSLDKNTSDSSTSFCRSTLLGQETRPRRIKEQIRNIIGNSSHLWMWDYNSMASALEVAGFVEIRRCHIGDASDSAFNAIEAADRFHDVELDIPELAIEAKHPSSDD